MIKSLLVNNQHLNLPIFCPDATMGVVRSLSPADLRELNLAALIVNTWHLQQYPGAELLENSGGIKCLMNYQGVIISDSGGFQVYSLFTSKPGFGKITDEGLLTYRDQKKQHRLLFTPEDSIKMQFALKSDIMVCLDHFTPPQANSSEALESVKRTIAWAKRSQAEFKRQLAQRGLAKEPAAGRPQLFAVIQGGSDYALRAYCAKELLKLGFDGYGLGGLPFDEAGRLDIKLCRFNASLTPDDLPKYAMGLGKIADIIALYQCGYQIFDCVLPTRDARHGRLTLFNKTTLQSNYLHLRKKIYQQVQQPLDSSCQCPTCQSCSLAYLHHLLKIGDSAYYRLATMHNLYQYQQLMLSLRSPIE